MSLLPKGHELPLFHPRMIRPAGRGPDLSKQNLFHSRMIRPVVGGGGSAGREFRILSRPAPATFARSCPFGCR